MNIFIHDKSWQILLPLSVAKSQKELSDCFIGLF
jgi:hypothetical protein